MPQPCTETAATQSPEVASKLSQYQVCAEKLKSFCPDVSALCRAITLNKDLLQHLNGSYQASAACPSSSSPSTSSSSPDFATIRKSMQCVNCWKQQVAELHKSHTSSSSTKSPPQ
ncbi:uncharacterized protein LOC144464402 [Epinephelus lanceolatus]